MSESAGLKQRKGKGKEVADSDDKSFGDKTKDCGITENHAESAPPNGKHKHTQSYARKMLFLAFVFMPIWPILDVTCPLTMWLPPFLQIWLAEFHARENEQKSLSADLECLPPATTMHGHLSEEDLKKVISESPYNSVLVKGYLTSSQIADTLQKFKETTGENKYTLIKGSYAPHQRLGSLFTKGISDGHPWKKFQNGFRRHLLSDLTGIWNGTQKDHYGAFVPVGQGTLHKLFNFTSKKMVMDTSFFADFSKKTVSTPIHATWTSNTLAIQLAGRKQWLVVDPLDMKKVLEEQKSPLHVSGKGSVLYPSLTLDANLEARLKLVTQEPGDLFYFPPYAAHAVVSDQGLNVMTALRFYDVKKAFSIHPWKTALVASLALVDNVVQGIRLKLGLNKYAMHYDTSKPESVFRTAINLITMSPVYDDLQLERLLESPCSRNETDN